jgi:hypothetical protein
MFKPSNGLAVTIAAALVKPQLEVVGLNFAVMASNIGSNMLSIRAENAFGLEKNRTTTRSLVGST